MPLRAGEHFVPLPAAALAATLALALAAAPRRRRRRHFGYGWVDPPPQRAAALPLPSRSRRRCCRCSRCLRRTTTRCPTRRRRRRRRRRRSPAGSADTEICETTQSAVLGVSPHLGLPLRQKRGGRHEQRRLDRDHLRRLHRQRGWRSPPLGGGSCEDEA